MLRPLDGLQIDPLLDQVPQGAHVSQLLHVLHSQGHSAIHLGFGGESAQAKSQARVCHVFLNAKCTQHIAGLQAGTGAGAATADCNVLWAIQRGCK